LPRNSRDTADGRRVRARVLAYFFLAGSGLGLVLMPFLPLAAHTNRAGEAAVLGLAAAFGVGLMVAAECVRGWLVCAAVAFGTLQISAVIALGHSTGALGTQIAYVWVILYSCYFLDRRQVLIELALVGVAYAAALAIVAAPNGWTQWVLTMVTIGVVALMVSALMRRLALREAESDERTEALMEAEERFRRAFDDAAIGMALNSLDGHYLRVNHALVALTGYKAEELVGKTFGDITHP
jgi:PAS domain-containing protein